MGRRPGQPAKRTELKRLTGNPGGRALNDREPEPDGNRPKIPPHVEGEAALTWEWLCDELDRMGILSSGDVAIMTLYCDTWAEYQEARAKVQKYGSILFGKEGTPFNSPYLNQEAMFKKQLERYASELGLTPSSRSRVHASPKAKANEKTKGFQVVG